MIIITVMLTLNVFIQPVSAQKVSQEKLEKARLLFYGSISDKDSLDKAITIFTEIGKFSQYTGMATTYLGALEALKGKFGFAPIRQYNDVLNGLEMMRKGIEIDPDNIESRFIRATTCFYLPFFFKAKNTALEDIQHTIPLFLTEYKKYPPDLIRNSIQFIQDNIEITEQEAADLELVKELVAQ